MTHRTGRALALLAAALAGCSGTHAQAAVGPIEVVVDRASGEVFLKNTSVLSTVVDGYSLASPTSSLRPAEWLSVAANYDASGDQSVDATSQWFVLSATSLSLAEASTVASSGALGAGEVAALGAVWTVGAPEVLAATLAAGSVTMDVIGHFRDLAADYDGDLEIGAGDYDLWSQSFGSTIDLRADGNQDGVVDAIDFTLWRDAQELATLAQTSFAASDLAPPLLPAVGLEIGQADPTATIVPEPSTSVLASLLGAMAIGRRPANRA